MVLFLLNISVKSSEISDEVSPEIFDSLSVEASALSVETSLQKKISGYPVIADEWMIVTANAYASIAGAEILKDGGTEFGRFKRDSSNFVIKSATSDKDIIFKGVDNSSTITALTLDMSDAGSATFNNHVTVGDDCTVTGNLGVGALNASYGFYNNTTSYLNGNTTVNANLTVDAGAISISGDGANAATLTETGAGLLTIALAVIWNSLHPVLKSSLILLILIPPPARMIIRSLLVSTSFFNWCCASGAEVSPPEVKIL